mmetsp:Transcript_21977/g.47954  ORF Transcript_21977/g.47954 Transcript_21977/m.47954 type:complete len:811 (-) Transcript_21977:32-2464(-)
MRGSRHRRRFTPVRLNVNVGTTSGHSSLLDQVNRVEGVTLGTGEMSPISTVHSTVSSASNEQDDYDYSFASKGSYVSSFSPPRKERVGGMSKSWVPDALATQCYGCSKEFRTPFFFGSRKHHCRICGNVFCGRCTERRMELCDGEKPVRVCEECFGLLQREVDGLCSADELLENDQEDVDEMYSVEPTLLPGEDIAGQYNQVYFEGIIGYAILTNFQLILIPAAGGDKIHVPLLSIERVEIFLLEEEEAGVINIFCKNLRFVRLSVYDMVSKQRFVEFHELEHTLVHLAFPAEDAKLCERFVSVSSCSLVPSNKIPSCGMISFASCCLKEHFNNVEELDRVIITPDRWRVSQANKSFALCSSYPRYIIVPASVTDTELFEVADFRSRRRIPAFSWQDPLTHLAICRSSQPKVGMLRGRSAADERLIQSIAKAGRSGLVIIDARPMVNATVNKVTVRGGFEDIDNYNVLGRSCRISIEFMDVQNTNTVRASMRKVKQLVGYRLKHPAGRRKLEPVLEEDFEIKWLERLSESLWLEHVAYIMKAAIRVVRIIKKEKKSVLVHCSDGWDRTSQIVSLALLLLDKHYRTIEGFIALIEKEWLSFGHPFRTRCGTGAPASKNSNKEIIKHSTSHQSPVFVQFFECVWQISKQFPGAFQFNEQMLILILDRVYDGRHSNFIVNNRRESIEQKLVFRSSCVWEEILSLRQHFVNEKYDTSLRVLHPSFSTKVLTFWRGYFLRFDETCKDFKLVTSQLGARRLSRFGSSAVIPKHLLDRVAHEICSSIVDEMVSNSIIQSLERRLAMATPPQLLVHNL